MVEALSRALNSIGGIDVRVFGLDDEAWAAGDRDMWKGARATTFGIVGPRAVGYAPGMVRALIEWDPDLVHTHGIWKHSSRTVLQWARRTGRPHIVSPHGMLDPWALRNSPVRKRLAGAFYENAHLQSAAALHALCSQEESAIRAFGLGLPIGVIPNGIDTPADVPLPAAPWRGMVPSQGRVMLFLGRLHPKKNLLPLLHAWRSARPLGPDGTSWRLVVAGWDQDGNSATLRAAIGTLGLSQDVVLLGPLFGADKEAAFRNAAAFVLPSLSEGLPMTVLEAFSYRLPVLMTDACNLPEAFSNGAARRLDLNPPQMVQDLSNFLALSPQTLDAMGTRGRAWIEQDFGWDDIAARMAELYRQNAQAPARAIRHEVA